MLNSAFIDCPNCPTSLPDTAAYCAICGERLTNLDSRLDRFKAWVQKRKTPLIMAGVGLFFASYFPSPYNPQYWVKRAIMTPTAECRDGIYSFSRSRSGTCSNHGGVSRWTGKTGK